MWDAARSHFCCSRDDLLHILRHEYESDRVAHKSCEPVAPTGLARVPSPTGFERQQGGHHSTKSRLLPGIRTFAWESFSFTPTASSGCHQAGPLGGHNPLRSEYNVPRTNRESPLSVGPYGAGRDSDGLGGGNRVFSRVVQDGPLVCAQVGVRVLLALPSELGSARSGSCSSAHAATDDCVSAQRGDRQIEERHCLISGARRWVQAMLSRCLAAVPGLAGSPLGAARAHRFLLHWTAQLGGLPAPGLEDGCMGWHETGLEEAREAGRTARGLRRFHGRKRE